MTIYRVGCTKTLECSLLSFVERRKRHFSVAQLVILFINTIDNFRQVFRCTTFIPFRCTTIIFNRLPFRLAFFNFLFISFHLQYSTNPIYAFQHFSFDAVKKFLFFLVFFLCNFRFIFFFFFLSTNASQRSHE